MKMYSTILSIPLLLMACSDDDNTIVVPSANDVLPVATTIEAPLTLDITTDKACYAPGQTVSFTLSGQVPGGAKVRYRSGNTVVGEQALSGTTWTWTAPATDFTGYLVDIYTQDGGSEKIYATTAVDVSSDWSRYPRYGFVATYDDTKTSDVVAQEMAFLNRCHINGVQFYDWMYSHQHPAPVVDGQLLPVYNDLANRTTYTSVVKDYIARQHDYGMKSMFYNLCYGTYQNAEADGVDTRWGAFKDQSHSVQDNLTMPSGWASDLMLTNPGNTAWQAYMSRQANEVYGFFDFDGYHIDQVGNRGTVYDYYGSSINMPQAFASYVQAMKQNQPEKRLVMNGVSNYGASQILGTGNVDFAYTELWGSEAQYSDLLTILKKNRGVGKTQGQVFAAYMNYESQASTFNTPGVLLTDAVMFALGASHLELGDHMLCNEYFPNQSLTMTAELRQAMVRYYDFLTAYEHLLRAQGTQLFDNVYGNNAEVVINSWPPRQGTVTTYSTQVAGSTVVSLLNFVNANSLSWRDADGSMPEPDVIKNLTISVKAPGVSRAWVASPDVYGGAPQALQIRQQGDYTLVTIPSLKYWSMLVLE